MNPESPTPANISVTAMQNAIDYAKQDPNSSYAQELQKRIQSGAYNTVLQQMGKDTSKYAQPAAAPAAVEPVQKPGIVDKVKSLVKETGYNYMHEVAPAAADVTGGGNIGGAVDSYGKISEGAPIGTDQGKADAHNAGKFVEDSTLGVASDAVRAIFAPITAPIMTLIHHSNAGSLPVTPEVEKAKAAIAAWAQAHPEISKTIGDSITVGGAAIGSGALDASVSDLATSAKSAVEDGLNTVKDAAGKAKTAIAGTAEEQATAKAATEVADAAKNQEAVTGLLKQNPETMTPTMKKAAVDEGRQTQVDNKLGGTDVDYTPTKETKRAAEVMSDPAQVPDPIKPTDKPNVVAAKVKTAIKVKGSEAEKYLEDNPVKLTSKEDFDMFSKMTEEADKVSTPAQMKAYQDQIDLFNKQLKGLPGGYTTANYYKALKAYEDNVASQFRGGKEALIDPEGIGSAKINAAADIRTTIRKMLGEKHPEFADKMYDIASLYEAKDNAIFNASKSTSKATILDKHPGVKKALKIGAEVGGLGGAGYIASKVI